jgi:hypothetical protein
MGDDVLRQQRPRRVALALALMILRVERVSGWSSQSHYYLTSPSVRISSRPKYATTAAAAAHSSDDPDNVPLPGLIATAECNNASASLSSSHTEAATTAATASTSLPPVFGSLRPVVSCDADRMSGTDLAYMGDVVYELFVRSRTVWPPQRTADRQDTAVALVRGTKYTLDWVRVLSAIASFAFDPFCCNVSGLLVSVAQWLHVRMGAKIIS